MKNTIILWGKWALSLTLIFSVYSPLSAQELKAEVSLNLADFNTDSAQEKFQILSEDLNVIQKQIERLYTNVEFDANPDGKKPISMEALTEIMQKTGQKFLAQNPNFIKNPVKHFIENYTLAELRELSQFYQSELGQKLLISETYLFNELMDARRELEEVKASIYEGEKGGKKKKKKRK